MRASMKFMMVCGEVLLFGLLVAASLRGAEFPPLKPTYLTASSIAATSPYSVQRPTRVTMTNKLGQVTTLEYRRPVKVVDDAGDDALVPINDLPLLSTPARAEDLVPISDARTVGYQQHQANYTTQPAVRYAYQAPIVPVAGCAQ